MSQKSSKSSSCQPIASNEVINWNNVLDNIVMDPLEREIYEEHMKAMKEFQGKKPVDPKSIKRTRVVESEECSMDEDDDPNMMEEDKDDRAKQREQAKQEFEEDEEFHAAQFRKLRDWETRKRLALENLEQPIELAADEMELLMYGTPIQLVNKVPDPDIPDVEINSVLAIYLTPECIARDQLFVDNETPLALSLDITPMGRNVFEIVSGDESMRGFPVTYKSVVYIKVHYNEDNRDFYLSIDISSPYTVGKLYLQDSIDDLCQFQLLSVNNMNNKNQELVDINSPVLIRHVKTGFFLISKVNITVMNICGEEKFVLGSDEIEGNNVLWKLIYGSFNDDFDFDFNSFVNDRWWQPEQPASEYIAPNATIKDPFFCSQPSTSRDSDAGPSNVPFSQQQVSHSIPEPCGAHWVEVQPGLQKSLGPPGAANEYMDNPEELFSHVKRNSFGRTKKESQQIVVDYLEALRNHNQTPPHSSMSSGEPSTWPKSKTSDRKSCVEKVENTIDFMKKLNPKANQTDLVRDNKFGTESFKWPKVPQIGSPNSNPMLNNPENIINAIRKINLQNAEMSPDREQDNNQLEELFVWPTIPDANTSTSTQEIIKKLEAEMINTDEFEDYIPTKLSKNHDKEELNQLASSDSKVPHLISSEIQKKYEDKTGVLKSKLDSTNKLPSDDNENENILLPDNFWDFFDSDNTHLMYSGEPSEAESNNSTTDNSEIDLELENVQIPASVSPRIEEGQGDMLPEMQESDKNISE